MAKARRKFDTFRSNHSPGTKEFWQDLAEMKPTIPFRIIGMRYLRIDDKFMNKLLGLGGWMSWVEGKVNSLPTINLVNCRKCGREIRGGKNACEFCSTRVAQ